MSLPDSPTACSVAVQNERNALYRNVYGLGAGIFFIGYVLCGVPSNLALNRFGPRRWIAVMMIAWGLASTALLLVETPGQLYALRLFTGAAEAGFFLGMVLYLSQWFPASRRGRIMALFMAAIPVSGLEGGPFSGWILNYSLYVTLSSRKHWLWRALDQHGAMLDVLVQRWRDRQAAHAQAAQEARSRSACPDH
ncbi:DDE superfamily endonuclease [Azotobacter chroococcum]|uniref:DDE superfamily endonuclease n=1 Tax=Azotobacter chroococcum TaxID=353 RepID=A0A4R1PU89_9GAMM|nr:DDE superfamily endonuclease [Azotobacter chroococcum]